MLTSTSRPPSSPSNLNRDRVNVVFQRDVADDAVGSGMLAGDPFDAIAASGDERDAGAAAEKLPDQRQTQARGAAGNGDAQPGESDR